jgi:putative transposase
LPIEQRRLLIDREAEELSVRRQCGLLGVARSGLYYCAAGEDAENVGLMRELDEQYTRTPYYGVLRMTAWLRREGWEVNPKRVRRLLRVMGLEAIYPKPKLSQPGEGHRIYPYLLRDVPIEAVDQVWSADITYIRMARSWLYLVAVMDWFSRYVLSWRLSASLENDFCVAALGEALRHSRGRRPGIFNTDQGSQFTSEDFTDRLKAAGVDISMDGRGRCLDNIFIERLWRSVKYEEVYLKDYQQEAEAQQNLGRYFRHYNHGRPHQALEYRTPAEVYGGHLRA